MKINFCDIFRQYSLLKKEIDSVIKKTIEHTQFINGPEIEELEKKLAEYVGVKNSIGVSSGTDALLISLMALDIQEGDFVITTPFTFIATAEVVSFLKATPIFADIDEKTLNINPEEIEKFLKNPICPFIKQQIDIKKIKGIIAVDIFGQPADYSNLEKITKEYDLFLLEDAAQSLGAKYKDKKAGSFGDISATSFFPSKPFGCYGDGGMIFTDNEKLAEKIVMIRNHGQKEKYDHKLIGLNSRLDTIQAAILLEKLKNFNKEIEQRQKIAKIYKEKLSKLPILLPEIKKENFSVYAQFCILTKKRNELREFLEKNEIPTAIHYPKPLHLQPAFSFLKHKEGDFPVAEKVSKEILSLPFDAYKTEEEVEYICEKIKEFYNNL